MHLVRDPVGHKDHGAILGMAGANYFCRFSGYVLLHAHGMEKEIEEC